MQQTELFKPDIPDEYLVEIGRVTTRWSTLESVLDMCLIKLIGKDIRQARSYVIFNHMAFPMKLDVMGTLVSGLLPSDPRPSGFPAVETLLKKAQERRNRIVHSKWRLDENKKVATGRLTARGKMKVAIEPVSITEIREAADVIDKACHDSWSLIMEAGATNNPPHRGQ